MEEQTVLTKRSAKSFKHQTNDAENERRMRSRKTKKYFIRGIGALVIAVAVVGLWKLSQQPISETPLALDDVLQTQTSDWTKGNPNSSVTLIEYLDFECGACGAYYPLVKRLSEEYGDKILFISRYFPLQGHKNGMTAALAVEAAGKQGKYWEMHDLLFEEQGAWGGQPSSDPAAFERYAEQIGLDIERFKEDVNSQEVRNRVISDKDAGLSIGVNSTPTFFLNGKKIQNPRGYEPFKALLDSAVVE